MEERRRFLETADVARLEGIAAPTVLDAVRAGRLRVAAVTARGTRLFNPEDVEAFRRDRAARRAARAAATATGQTAA